MRNVVRDWVATHKTIYKWITYSWEFPEITEEESDPFSEDEFENLKKDDANSNKIKYYMILLEICL